MRQVDLLLIHAEQLVTCTGNGQPKRGDQMRDVGIIPDGALAVQDGHIVAVGTTDEITAHYASEQAISARDKAVIPGLVDCHTHTVYAGNRLDEFEMRIQGKTYMDIMAAGGGIMSTVRATRAAQLQMLYEESRARLDTMLRLGTTTAEIKTGYGLHQDAELKMLAVILKLATDHPMTLVPTFLGAHAVPPEYPDAVTYAEAVIHEILPAITEAQTQSGDSSPFFIDVFCEKGVFDLTTSRRVLVAGQQSGMGIKAHVDEFVNLGGVTMAVALGATSVDHLDVTPETELDLLAASDTVGVALPAVNFNLGATHFANARYLIDAGGVLALATDINPGSAPTPSMPMVMAIASRYQKLLPAEALNASTLNAAYAIGLGDRVGSLEVGKQADCLILDTPDYRSLIYEFGVNRVESVIIKGEQII
ncbi:MAG: imidazolonepropionase [Anaerolineaceae bacterium]|nr:imidazolonepropionase [Anaerolineaceae bacterium]